MTDEEREEFDRDFERQVKELAKKLEDEGKMTREACESYLLELYDLYHADMEVAAMMILAGEHVEFLTPEEIQKMVDDHNNQAIQNAERLKFEEQQRQAQLAAAFQDDSLGCFSIIFTLVKWLILIASGLIVPYLCYRAIKLVIKAVIKSRRGA